MIEIDKLVRSKRKTLSVSVNALGEVTVRAPMRVSEKDIAAFLQTHEKWIEKKKEAALRSGVALPTELDGYRLTLLGEKYELHLYPQNRVALDRDNKRLFLPEKNAEKRLVAWLKNNALRICTQHAEERAREMGVTYSSLSITSARSFWGICTAKDELRFSYRLLYVPKEVLEYVIVHELSHIRHKDHSRAFWDEVERYIPDWKEKRAYLKSHALLMRVF